MKKFFVLISFLFLICLTSSKAQIVMSQDSWKISEAGAKFENYHGQQSIFLKSGSALLKDAKFEDGTIEVDITAPSFRVFAGIVFRAQSFDESEVVYIRLHKNGLPDAIQYTPRFRGIDPWQLYNVGYTAEAAFKREEWTHLKLEIAGRTLRIYVNNSAEPNLVVEDMKRHEGRGEIGLMALNGAYFSNFTYTSRALSGELAKPKNEFQAGTISTWDVSQSFPFSSEKEFESYPAKQQSGAIQWEQLNSETPGFLNISRYRSKAKIDNATFTHSDDVVYVRKKIVSSKEQMKKLFFGYSDRVTIFLNGKILFNGNSSFRSRDAQFLGAIGLNDAVFLDLKKGENELLFVVADKSGGWGIQARFADTTDIKLN